MAALRKGYTAFLALLISVAVVATHPAFADTDDRQYKIEAAFLYNFFNYITWPGYASPQAMQQSVICLYGEDPVEPYLEYIQRKGPGERKIQIRVLKDGEDAAQCQIVFLRNPTPVETQTLASQHILVVSEATDTADKNGMIELFRENERMRMRINQPLLEKNNFQVSSRLLNIAEVIK